MAQENRNNALDGLRGLSILAVMIHHIGPGFAGPLPLGWAGVRIFFVLSGFLITRILLECRGHMESGWQSAGFTIRQFYWRRLLRIFPIFFLAIAILWIFDFGEVRKNLLWHAAYLSNIKFSIDGYYHDYVAHFWSLDVEEQFYLIWPMMMLLLPRKCLIWAILGTIAAGIVYRYAALSSDVSGFAFEAIPLSCLDTLGGGALLAFLLYQGKSTRGWAIAYSACGVVGGVSLIADVLLPDNIAGVPRLIFMPTALAFFTVSVIHHIIVRPHACWTMRILSFKPLRYIGTISYGLYIYHAIIQSILVSWEDHLLKWGRNGEIVLYFLLSLIAASLSWQLIEKPLNCLKRFIPYKSPKKQELGPQYESEQQAGSFATNGCYIDVPADQ